MYYGHSTVAIDSKGRTAWPRELRRMLPAAAEGQVVVTVGPGRSLLAWDEPTWQRLLRGLIGADPRVREDRSFRVFTGLAAPSTLDEQNRIALTPRLIQHAELAERVVFAGHGDHVVLQRPELFESDIEGQMGSGALDSFLLSLPSVLEGGAP